MNVELVIGNVKLFALRAMLNFSITNYICRRHSLFNIQYSIFSKFADDCGSAAQESKLVEKNNSNSRQFLTFVVVRKNRSVEEVNQSIFQNGVYRLFRTSPT